MIVTTERDSVAIIIRIFPYLYGFLRILYEFWKSNMDEPWLQIFILIYEGIKIRRNFISFHSNEYWKSPAISSLNQDKNTSCLSFSFVYEMSLIKLLVNSSIFYNLTHNHFTCSLTPKHCNCPFQKITHSRGQAATQYREWYIRRVWLFHEQFVMKTKQWNEIKLCQGRLQACYIQNNF